MWQRGLPDQRDKIKARGSNPSTDARIATPVQPGSEWPGPRSAPRSHGAGGSTRLPLPHTLQGCEATGPQHRHQCRAGLCSAATGPVGPPHLRERFQPGPKGHSAPSPVPPPVHTGKRREVFFTGPQADILHQHFFDPRT